MHASLPTFINGCVTATHHVSQLNQSPMSQDTLQFRLMRALHEMDHQTQAKATSVYRWLVIIVAIVSYLVANHLQQFSICVYSVLAAMAVSCIIVIPGQAPWWKNTLPNFRPNSEKERR